MPVVALSVLKGCRKKGIQRVDLSSRHVPNNTELCELLTSPPGAISYVVFAASSYLDIPGSAPSISQLGLNYNTTFFLFRGRIQSLLFIDIPLSHLPKLAHASSACKQSSVLGLLSYSCFDAISLCFVPV
ncbi:hypothetical protein FOC1_g10000390 [Fusarium oxysporum f. sp. cubense race 1]|uniref:Uncharacterized protein n=1 Tax=Fusarium oxysporum f. sp. cubense (strain race 1) TaxID=1229664 RepID=N4U3M4_FUSC1|nr:hypothetical protein FOC1_g10000390 [Fusarium oxysporum f. sp. cubense race 1]